MKNIKHFKTPKGDISVKIIDDKIYPGVQILANNEIVVIVENGENGLRAIVYADDKNDEPTHIIPINTEK
jgi:hypothetical protein